jgi:hypothetical protein
VRIPSKVEVEEDLGSKSGVVLERGRVRVVRPRGLSLRIDSWPRVCWRWGGQWVAHEVAAVASMSQSSLANLPSSGLCAFTPKPGRKIRTAHAPTYLPLHDTSPPADQIITTNDSNQLLERFRALLNKEKDARMLKRSLADGGGSRQANPDKRQKL